MTELERVTTKQAAKELNTTVLNIQESLIQGLIPIGYAIKKRGSSRYTFIIYRGLLDGYKKRIAEGVVAKDMEEKIWEEIKRQFAFEGA